MRSPLCAQVNHAVVTAREAVKCGKCVVIGLQSTGEARTLDQLERDDGELSDFVSTAKSVLPHFNSSLIIICSYLFITLRTNTRIGGLNACGVLCQSTD